MVQPAGRGLQVLTMYSFFAALTTIVVALRLYCRAYIQKAFGWDDYAAAMSWVRILSTLCEGLSAKHHLP